MGPIVIRLAPERKRFLHAAIQQARRWRLRRNILIILACAQGRGVAELAALFHCSTVTLWRVKRRFLACGLGGLRDRRRTRSPTKATRHVAQLLLRLVRASPADFGLSRPTWTRWLLAEQLCRLSGVGLSVTTVGRLLARIGARWNRPCPVVSCPWPEDKRKKTLEEIRAMLANLPATEIGLFEDEVDIHLNPKIGFDWMMRAQQKHVVTPGQNSKRHLAGALQAKAGQLVWVRGDRKDSVLFIELLREIVRTWGSYERIHLVLDNYSTHKSKATEKYLTGLGGKIELHFLPPYCPRANKMELVWLHLHQNVTRNHHCTSIEQLLERAEHYLSTKSLSVPGTYRLAA